MTGCYGQSGSGHTSESHQSAVVNSKFRAKKYALSYRRVHLTHRKGSCLPAEDCDCVWTCDEMFLRYVQQRYSLLHISKKGRLITFPVCREKALGTRFSPYL